MKAEERHELEQNTLAKGINNLREKFHGRAIYVLVGIAALIVAAVVFYRYFSNSSRQAEAARVLDLENATTPERLKEIMEIHRGHPEALRAKLHLARRALILNGTDRLGTDRAEDRKNAVASVEEARKLYLELTTELKNEPSLTQEAWIGVARAEESLIGIPTDGNPDSSRGDINKAIEYYEKAAAVFPDTDFSKKYLKRAEDFKKNKDKIVADLKNINRERGVIPPPPK